MGDELGIMVFRKEMIIPNPKLIFTLERSYAGGTLHGVQNKVMEI